MQKPRAACHEDLHNISSNKDLQDKDSERDIHPRTPQRISQDGGKKTCCWWSRSSSFLIQDLPKSLPDKLSDKHLMQEPLREAFARISTRSFVKNLCKVMQGPVGEEFCRMSTRALLCNKLQ